MSAGLAYLAERRREIPVLLPRRQRRPRLRHLRRPVLPPDWYLPSHWVRRCYQIPWKSPAQRSLRKVCRPAFALSFRVLFRLSSLVSFLAFSFSHRPTSMAGRTRMVLLWHSKGWRTADFLAFLLRSTCLVILRRCPEFQRSLTPGD